MERDTELCFTPVDHPDSRVRQVGFDLDHPYVERCSSYVLGPSSTVLLRRMTALWIDQVPGRIPASELARSLGLGPGTGDRGRLFSTLDRLVYFGYARPATDGPGLDVYSQVPPLQGRQLERAPEWTRRMHDRLLDSHLEQLANPNRQQSPVTSLQARLDRLQRPAGQDLGLPARALGR